MTNNLDPGINPLKQGKTTTIPIVGPFSLSERAEITLFLVKGTTAFKTSKNKNYYNSDDKG